MSMRPHTSGTNQNRCSWGTKNSGHEGMFVEALFLDVSKWLVNILRRDNLVHLHVVESSPLQKQMLANGGFFLPPESQRLWG